MQMYSFKNRILIPLSLALAILLTGFVVSFYQNQKEHLHADSIKKLESVEKLFVTQLDNDAQTMMTGLEIVLHDEHLKTALKNKDREALLEHALLFFKQLQSKHRITHFYFTGPDRINILRVHKPDKYGDKIDRYTTLEAERSGKFSSGIELGPLGTFTLRVVAPWYEDDRLIGYVEFGEEVDHITQELHEILNVEIYVLIEKKFLNRENWEAGMRMLGRKPAWDQFPAVVMVDRTADFFPENLVKCVNEAHYTSMQPDVEVSLNHRKYRTGFLHLKDVGGHVVGDMVIMFDVTDMNSNLHTTVFQVSAICLAVGGVLFVLFHIFLGQIERQMAKSSEALRESEIQKKAILDGITSHIVFVNKDLEIQWANAAAGKSADKSPEELVGHKCYEFWGNPEKPCENCSTANVFRTNKPNQGVKHFPDGRIWETRAEPVFDDDGNLMGVVEINLDITEKTRMETQLQQARKLESIGHLAGGIAHDFNNLLFIVMGNLALIEDDIKPVNGVAEYLKNSYEACRRAQALTKQLITFSQGGAPVKKSGSIGDLLKEITTFSTSDSNVEFNFSIPHDLCLVEHDEGQMNHAIKNIIINAIESMPAGGTIDVKAENYNITVKRELPLPEGKYVKISIRDQGVGIPKEHLSMIFDPYFSTKEMGTQKGMGLGLAIVYSIINRHDGHITVKSQVGVGTTFNLYLPVHKKETRELGFTEMPKSEKPAIRTGRILLMDDEKSIRDVTKHMLSRLDYDPDFANEGAEAIKVYKEAIESGKPFEAVILDLTIKEGMGGVDTIKKLLEIDPQIRAIISSGYSNDPVMTDFRQYGFRGALAKPYTMQDLGDVLKKAVIEKS